MRLFNNNNKDEEKKIIEIPHEEPEIEDVSADEEEVIEHSEIVRGSDERIVEEDTLLVQIDDFRKKAETLQALINARQNQVIELEDVVKDKESKNSKLQEELDQKQDALENVLGDMKNQFDILADRIDTSVYNAVTEAKEPILDKIHTENVRLYRNVYDFIKEDYDVKKLEEMIAESNKGGKIPMIVTLVLSALNFSLLVYLVLSNLIM